MSVSRFFRNPSHVRIVLVLIFVLLVPVSCKTTMINNGNIYVRIPGNNPHFQIGYVDYDAHFEIRLSKLIEFVDVDGDLVLSKADKKISQIPLNRIDWAVATSENKTTLEISLWGNLTKNKRTFSMDIRLSISKNTNDANITLHVSIENYINSTSDSKLSLIFRLIDFQDYEIERESKDTLTITHRDTNTTMQIKSEIVGVGENQSEFQIPREIDEDIDIPITISLISPNIDIVKSITPKEWLVGIMISSIIIVIVFIPAKERVKRLIID